MAVLPASNKFEGGTTGTAITAANSGGASGTAFDAVVGTTTAIGAFSNAQAAHGSLSATWNYTGTASNVQLNWTGLNQATLYGRFYLRMAALPVGANAPHLQIQDTAGTPANSCRLIVTTAGKLQYNNAANTAIAASLSTTVLAANTWYRIEWSVTTGTSAGIVTWQLYVGDSAAATETNTQTAQALTANNLGQVRYGCVSNPTTYQFWLDDVQANATGFPGPAIPRLISATNVNQAITRAATL